MSEGTGAGAGRATVRGLLFGRRVWIAPMLIGSIFIALVATIYIGSVIDPTGHLHGLPVMVVDEDAGAQANGQELNVGASVVRALEQSSSVTSRLKLRVASAAVADREMNSAHAYATLVIPRTLSRSVLLASSGGKGAAGAPARGAITLEENQRLGSLGVNLAAGVIKPAAESASASVGKQLAPLVGPETRSNPVLAAQAADPIALKVVTYRPLPDHTALGLSAFYIALLAILAGFIAATLINTSLDSALGYSSSEMGPRWTLRRPTAIRRRTTFLAKWAAAAIVVPVLTAILLLIAIGALGMHGPHTVLLWLLCTLAAMMIATATRALLAALGSIGQLLAMLLLIYLSLASSGGTVPTQALPGVFGLAGKVEPLRQVLGGTRAILYFGAAGDAGLTHAVLVLICELVFWAAVGLLVTSWYDRRKMDRIAPEVLEIVNRAIDRGVAEGRGGGAVSEPGAGTAG